MEKEFSQSFLFSILENSSDIVFVIDIEGIIYFVSPPIKKNLGYDFNDFKNKKLIDFIHPDDVPEILSHFSLLTQNPEITISFEFRILAKNNNWHIYEIKAKSMSKKSIINGIILNCRDITLRKITEKSLYDNLQFLQILIDTIPNPIFYKDKKGRYLGCNKTFASQIAGLNLNEIVYKTVFDLPDQFSKEQKELFHRKDQELINNPGFQTYEIKINCVDGVLRDFIFDKATFKNSKDEIEGLVGIMSDVTEIKKAKKQTEEMAIFAEQNPAPVLRLNTNGQILIINESARDLFKGKNLLNQQWLYPKNKFIVKIFNNLKNNQIYQHELEINKKTYLFTYRYDSKFEFINIYGADISENKKAENLIKYRVEIEKMISSVSTFFINLPLSDIDKGINKTLEELGLFIGVDRCYLFLYDKDRMKLKHKWYSEKIKDKNLNDFKPKYLKWVMKELKNGKELILNQIEDIPEEGKKDKKIFKEQKIKSLISVPLIYSNKLLGILGFDTIKKIKNWNQEDVNALKVIGEIFINTIIHKNNEVNIRANEKKFRNLFNQSNDAILLLNKKGDILDLNNKTEELLEIKKDYIVNKNLIDYYLNKNEFIIHFKKILKNNSFKIESQFITKNKKIIDVDISSKVVDKDNETIQMIVRDITERKKTEKELKLLSRAVEQSLSTIVITDTAGDIIYANPNFERTTGYSKSEVLGTNPRILKTDYHPDSFYKYLWKTLIAGKTWYGEFKNKKKNKEEYWEEAVISPVYNEKNKLCCSKK